MSDPLTPWTIAYHPSLSLGFPRQEYWSGLSPALAGEAHIEAYLYILYKHMIIYCMKVKVTQSCPTLCDPMDYTAHGILQARILEWVAFPFSRGSPNPGI